MNNDLKDKIISKYYPKCNDMFRENLTKIMSEYENSNVKTKQPDLSNDSSSMNTFGRDN